MGKDWALLISCEHGGNRIPREYKSYVDQEFEALLKTHRGWDPGALMLAKEISRTENAPLYFTEVSRLVIDCNRSIHHKSCFGPVFRDADDEVKRVIAEDFYHPYRQSVVDGIERLRKQGYRVLHFAFHSFTPELNGEVRTAELGLLYDPARKSEKRWADIVMESLRVQGFSGRARRNYPYLGKADGFTKYLRGAFGDSFYAGFEIEFNQALIADASKTKILKGEMARVFASLPLTRGAHDSGL